MYHDDDKIDRYDKLDGIVGTIALVVLVVIFCLGAFIGCGGSSADTSRHAVTHKDDSVSSKWDTWHCSKTSEPQEVCAFTSGGSNLDDNTAAQLDPPCPVQSVASPSSDTIVVYCKPVGSASTPTPPIFQP